MAITARGFAAVLLATVCGATVAGGSVTAAATGTGHHAGRAAARESVGPRNGRIFFATGFAVPPFPDTSGNWQIYSMRKDGSDIRQLTHVPDTSVAGDPSVSPDGRTVAYVSNESGQFGVWLMDTNGRNQRQVLSSPNRDYLTPGWSPNGQRLVVAACHVRSGGFEDFCDLVTVRDDGSHARTIVHDHRYDYYGRYSPGGKWIAFGSDRHGFEGAIWVVRASGGRPRRVTEPRLEAFIPSWSPDGHRLIFTDNCCQIHSNVYTIRPDGTDLTKLTRVRVGHDAAFASYSPDGRRIVLVSSVRRRVGSAALDVFTMRADGSQLHRIESTHQPVFLCSWGRAPESARSRGEHR